MSAWDRFLESLFGMADLSDEARRKRRLAAELALLIITLGSTYSLIYVALGFPAPAYISLSSVVAMAINLIVFYTTRRYRLFSNGILSILVVFGFMGHVFGGGFIEASGLALCTLLAALGALVFANLRLARIFFAIYVVGMLGVGIWELFFKTRSLIMPYWVIISFFSLNFIFIGAIIYLVLESFYRKLNYAQEALMSEKEKTEELLLNILPAEIARELKESGWAKARGYDSATVCLCDIVDFSTTSRQLTPSCLVQELDLYFRAFDDIIEKYKLEKIKTMGDAYMFAGGLPLESGTHAVDVAGAALDIQKAVEEINQSGAISHPFKIRIGIHSGPLVAGVVGKKKFVYDIWGETVNIAARMEQSGESGRVNISETAYLLLRDHFKCTYRGKITAKNHGLLDMYFIERRVS